MVIRHSKKMRTSSHVTIQLKVKVSKMFTAPSLLTAAKEPRGGYVKFVDMLISHRLAKSLSRCLNSQRAS